MESFNFNSTIDFLTKLLKSDPQVSITPGPISSWKLLLIRKITQDIKKHEKIPVLYMNLRNVSFNSVSSFVSLKTKM